MLTCLSLPERLPQKTQMLKLAIPRIFGRTPYPTDFLSWRPTENIGAVLQPTSRTTDITAARNADTCQCSAHPADYREQQAGSNDIKANAPHQFLLPTITFTCQKNRIVCQLNRMVADNLLPAPSHLTY